MPSLSDVADRAFVDVDDALVMLVSLVGDGAELNLDDLYTDGYPDLASNILELLRADERALAHPPHSPAADLARAYRDTGDEALLVELRERGHGRYADFLAFERPQPDDLPSHLRTRAQISQDIDTWIAAAPADPSQLGQIRYVLGD